MRIADLPPTCRPRERLLASGAQALSDAELLAVFLRTGVAGKSALELGAELLTRFGSLRALLSASPAAVQQVGGVGPAKLAQLRAALELGRRMHEEELERGNVLDSPRRVRDFLRSCLGHDSHESFGIIFLDARNRFISWEEMFRGTLSGTQVHVREIVRMALEKRAAGVILAHNHPSGVPTPSASDHVLTRHVQRALAMVDVTVHDHFIIAGRRSYSFSERGDMPTLPTTLHDC